MASSGECSKDYLALGLKKTWGCRLPRLCQCPLLQANYKHTNVVDNTQDRKNNQDAPNDDLARTRIDQLGPECDT